MENEITINLIRLTRRQRNYISVVLNQSLDYFEDRTNEKALEVLHKFDE